MLDFCSEHGIVTEIETISIDQVAEAYERMPAGKVGYVALPFLDDDLITWRPGTPVRYSGGILPEGAEKLYFVGLISPRGPQIPVYGEQAKLINRMLALHAEAGPDGLALTDYFATMQDPEVRVDVVRATWNEQMADTEQLLAALAATSVGRTRHQARAVA